MRNKNTMQIRKKVLATAITASLGIASVGIPNQAISDEYIWGEYGAAADPTIPGACTASPDAATVIFTMVDAAGAGMANTSITTKGANQYQTAICGTLTYDTATSSGSAEFAAFDFFAGTLPAVAKGVTFNRLASVVANGDDSILFANMLFDWNGTVGIPVSLIWNAEPLLAEMDGTPSTFSLNADGSIVGGIGSELTGSGDITSSDKIIPASDGTYVSATALPGTVVGPGGYVGYLGLGPVPLATTAYNATPNCIIGTADCENNPDSGILPLITDTATNNNDYAPPNNLGGTIAASPMLAGPFQGSNANFDFTSMKLVSFTDTTPPVITLGGSQGALINKVEGESYIEDGATCKDAAPLNTDITVTPAGFVPDPLTVAGSPFTVTYDCVDASGINATQLTRTINVVAAGTDVITLTGDATVNHECAIDPYDDAGATCTTPSALTYNDTALDVFTVGTQSVTYTCNAATPTDRTVIVVDTTNPDVTLVAATDDIVSSTPENSNTYSDPGATVTDTCDTGIISPILASAGSVDMIVPDTGLATVPYDLIYQATDTTGVPGNVGTATRTVNVTRSQPVITLVGGGEVLKVGDTYTEKGMDIQDAQDLSSGDLTGITVSGIHASGLEYTISGTVDTSTEGEYTITYTVTDSDSNLATEQTRSVNVGIFAGGSNFSMLDAQGNVFGGTNDVAFKWDGKTFNTDESDTNFGLMTIETVKPQEFFGFVWVAHHIRIFENTGTTPLTFTFDVTCTTTQLEAGMGGPGANCDGPFDPGQTKQFLSMTVAPGQIGAHILFDWNTSSDIDVVNVYDIDGVWDRHGKTGETNKLFDGPAGEAPDPETTWKLVSTDFDGDDFNGSPMIDGPFQGSNANFNAGPQGTVERKPYVGTALDTSLGNGILASLNLWGLLAGVTGLLGLRRFKRKS